jgi:rubrerythrin
MNTEYFLKEFTELLKYEERARDFYKNHVDQIDDEDIKKELIAIRDDEEMHIRLVNRLIALVSEEDQG